MTTCRRATRPPRPLRRPRAPLPHGATWLAGEHDCLELILPRGPVPSIRGDCHRPDPFGVSTEKAGGKRDMSLLAERGGSLLTLPLCTGQTPGARRASPRGGQPDRRCEAPREAGDAAGSAPAARTPEAPERGSKGNSSLSGSLSQAPSCLPPTTKDTGGHDGRQPHRTYLCSPATPHTCDSPRERGGQRRHPRSHGREGPGLPPPTVTATATATATSAPSARATLGPPPPVPGSPATPSIATPTTCASTGEALCSRAPRASPRKRRWSHRCTDGEARPPPECGTARGGPVGPRPAPPHTSRQHARL